NGNSVGPFRARIGEGEQSSQSDAGRGERDACRCTLLFVFLFFNRPVDFFDGIRVGYIEYTDRGIGEAFDGDRLPATGLETKRVVVSEESVLIGQLHRVDEADIRRPALRDQANEVS